jgi:hypothetical protein
MHAITLSFECCPTFPPLNLGFDMLQTARNLMQLALLLCMAHPIKTARQSHSASMGPRQGAQWHCSLASHLSSVRCFGHS